MQPRKTYIYYLAFLNLSLFFAPLLLSGQNAFTPIHTLQTAVDKAQEYLSAAQPDSAMYVLEAPLQQIKGTPLWESPQGLEAQYIYAQSLEIDQQDSIATVKLLALKDRSRELKQWSIYARSALVLGLIHEKLGRPTQSKVHLNDAKITLKQFPIDSVYSSFAIRYSSWHRLYGDRDSAQYYAEEALTYTRKVGDISGEAQGHLLLGILSSRANYLEAIVHYQEAKRLCASIDDYLGETYYNNSIASLYLRNGYPEKALLYNDSSLIGVRNAVRVGYDENWIGHRPNRFRGLIFKELGQLDSAFFYLEKGANMEMANLRASQQKEVAQIDAIYKDDKKNLLVEQQAKTIRQGRLIRYLLSGLILLILVITYIQIRNTRKLRRVNSTIKDQAERLHDLDEMKSQFFANVSHELRTPLTLMMGPIQSLQENNHSKAKQQKLLRQVQQSGAQLEQLIQEILALQKLEAGTLSLYKQATSLSTYFRPHLAQFESLANYQSIEYTYELDLTEQQVVNIDREKVRQVLYNLLSNAFKFTPPGQAVKVYLSSDQDQLQVRVTDTGMGIPAEDLPHIFDRYFQSKEPGLAATGGTGIGLAICQEYTRLMGGTIEVESKIGKGTTFLVRLPLEVVQTESKPVEREVSEVESAASVLLTKPSKIMPARSDKPKLLLVDDNPSILAYLKEILDQNYALTTAQNGEEALKILAAQPDFQLILCDLMMPVMDGQQLLLQLKAQEATRPIPVVLLTARADMGSKLQALQTGVDDYLLKPFNEEELKARIENLLKNQAKRQEVLAETAPANDKIKTNTPEDQAWLSAFETYIQNNLSSDILSVPQMASHFSMSKSTLFRKLKGLTGLSPKQYLQEIRLQGARQQLERKNGSSIRAIAESVGYQDVRSFSRLYKKRFGKLPSEY